MRRDERLPATEGAVPHVKTDELPFVFIAGIPGARRRNAMKSFVVIDVSSGVYRMEQNQRRVARKLLVVG